ncbi:MAG: hypothetical protein H6508_01050 [Calditrichaeota bacterium]|nr:hypothetical protein [Calditrichota bacterium]MCB9365763.1 hypothetical protein [Calditrichota bacterium]
MNKKMMHILLALGLAAVMAFSVGCSSDDDDEPQGPTIEERLTGSWETLNPELLVGDPAGRVEFLLASDMTFSLKLVFPSGPLDDDSVTYTGDWMVSEGTSLALSNVDLDGEPNDPATMSWPMSLSSENDSLHVTHNTIVETPVEVLYLNQVATY